jgi:RNA polymerase sigma-70 factor (ECF subfamily)
MNMFNQCGVHDADISESGIMNALISVANKATAIEPGPTQVSEAALLSMAKLGNGEAFVVLSKLHSKRILPTVYNITRNWHDAEDALQEAMLRAFCNLKNFEERSSFATWLTRIAINAALMTLRKKRGSHETPLDGMDDSGDNYVLRQVESAADDPESALVEREREELLNGAITQLPRLLREVVELRFMKGYSTKEIAEALSITIPAVKSRLARARSSLRTVLLQRTHAPNPIHWNRQSRAR